MYYRYDNGFISLQSERIKAKICINCLQVKFETLHMCYHSFLSVKEKYKSETNKVKKEHYLIRQYNIQICNKIIFFKYSTRQIKARETNK